MLPPLEELLSSHRFLRLRYGWRWDVDAIGLAQALREAEALAGGRAEDEPAALWFSLVRHRNDLADAWEVLPTILVKRLVRVSLHAELDVALDDPDLYALRMRTVARDPLKRATFADVRAFLAARTRPLP